MSDRAKAITHRRVVGLAAPIILSNLSAPLVGIVDTAVVGQFPDGALIGAVAIGSMLFNFLYWGFGFLRMGTTGLVAQALGAGDAVEVRHVLGRALLLGGLIGLTVLSLQAPIALGAFALLEGSQAVESGARTYFDIRIWSAPAALANYALIGWLMGTQRPRETFAVMLALHGSNVVLTVWLGLGLGRGIAGVATASVIAEYAAAGLGLTLAWRRLRGVGGPWDRDRLLDRDRLVALYRISGNIFVRTLLLIIAFSWFTATGAAIGDSQLAANAVLMHFQSVCAYGLDGFAHATEALVGNAVGARDRAAFRRAVRLCTFWAALTAALASLVYLAAGGPLIDMMARDPAVRETARTFLAWAAAGPILSVWSFQLDGVFIGATRGADMRNAMIQSFAVYALVMVTIVPAFGNHGLWFCLMTFMLVRALTLMPYLPRLLQGLVGPAAGARPGTPTPHDG